MKAIPSSLQAEIRQSSPFPSAQEEAILSILRTADLIRTAIGDLLAPSGITMQQYNVLRILRGAGSAGLPTLAIGDRMIETAPGITRLLDRMEAKGWVSRERCKLDRRVVHAHISARGLDLLAALDEPLQSSAVMNFIGVEESTLVQLAHLLACVRRSIHPGAAAPTCEGAVGEASPPKSNQTSSSRRKHS
ncbi:MAG: MarR family transcriptional regulator [Bryobacterales bacterium]|nr:MarR family transcriptional regulator [Bryobacterales bacterium]